MDRPGPSPKVGVLGGSFNPAHEGHIEISKSALNFLELDFVWWLVSTGNPLKDTTELLPFEQRANQAREIVDDPRIVVSEMEKNLETRYTIDTLERMIINFPQYHFVWLMGADNLINFHEWKEWRKIAETVPIAIFNRPGYSKDSMQCLAANALKDYRVSEDEATLLHRFMPPAWVYCEKTNNPMSSTEIRRKAK